jgi:D-mannonate dehydratase
MSKSSRRGFVTSTMAAGVAAFSAAPEHVLAGNLNPVYQVRGKEKPMKFAVEMGTIGGGTPEDAIQYCKDLEIEGISVPWGRVPGFREKGYVEADRLKALRAQIEEAGLTLPAMVTSVPATAVGSGAEADARFEDIRRNLKSMAAAKVDTLVTFVPASQKTPWEQVVGLYRRLLQEAEPCGVRIATHTSGGLRTYAALNRLMQDVPSANNGLCYCTGNIWHGEGEKMYDIPRQLSSKIFFMHIRNVRTGLGEKEFYFDQGDIDFPRLVGVLKKIGHRGYLRSEHLPTDHYGQPRASDVSTAWAVGYMKALL